jgi:hypothetical protein
LKHQTLTLFRMIPVVFLLFPTSLASGQSSLHSPQWSDVEINLTVKGQYSIREEGTVYAGDFLFETTWSGTMEKDDDDYILYHTDSEILRWEVREKIATGGDQKVLTEKDFGGGPMFRMDYVLNENGVLRFVFVVDGFPVPRGGIGEKFDLILPASKKEGGGLSPSGYDASVVKGSNEVVFEEKMVRAGPAERAFQWEWKRYQPSSGPGVPVVLLNTHAAEVKIAITPRY